MCDCRKTKEALDNAMIALDGAINALVMARIILDQSTGVDKPVDKPKTNVACEHTGPMIDVSSMGNVGAQMCGDCGENL